MKHLMRDIAQLHEAFGHPVAENPSAMEEFINCDYPDKGELRSRHLMRLRLVAEEFFELLEGALGPAGSVATAEEDVRVRLFEWQKGYTYDASATADALVDLMVVIVGMGLELGIPLDVVWAEVHRANMAKVGPDGKVAYRPDGKVLKPDGWTPPRIHLALAQPSDAWTDDEVQQLVKSGLPKPPPGQEPFRYLLERYNQLANNHRQVSIALEALQSTSGPAPSRVVPLSEEDPEPIGEKPSEEIRRGAEHYLTHFPDMQQHTAWFRAILDFLDERAW